MDLYLENDSSKCGEIFISNNGNFIISCDFCSEKFSLENYFTKHFSENHLSDDLSDFNDSEESLTFDNIEDKDFIDTDVAAIENEISTEQQIINQHYDEIYGAEALYQANGSVNSKDGITLINANEIIEVLDEYEDIYIDSNRNIEIKPEILEKDINDTKISTNDNSINIPNVETLTNNYEQLPTQYLNNFSQKIEEEINNTTTETSETRQYLDNFSQKLKEEINNTKKETSDQIHFFECIHCNIKFTKATDLTAHYIVHKVHNKCTFCNKSYTKMEALKLHELKHLNPYQCSFCEKTFFKKPMLQEHENIHLGIKPHKCEFCPATFTSRTNLRVHRNRHLNVRPYSCSYCDKTFVGATERKMHERAHRGERPAICDICGVGFINTQKLNEHKKRHLNIKDFQCDSCSKAFYSKQQLDQHKVCHMPERSFICGVCNAKFKRKKNLLQHYRIHSTNKMYKCDICYKNFTQSSGLEVHMKKHVDSIPNNNQNINDNNDEDTDHTVVVFDENDGLNSVDQFIGVDVDKIIPESILIDDETLIDHII